jgi:hypothetical protein
MSDPVLIALIVTIPAAMNAISNFWLHRKVDDVKADVGTVKEEINGRMGELLKVTGESEKAKGVMEGRSRAGLKEEHSG